MNLYFLIYNQVNQETFIFPVDDTAGLQSNYIKFEVNLPKKIKGGEYQYILFQTDLDEVIISTDVPIEDTEHSLTNVKVTYKVGEEIKVVEPISSGMCQIGDYHSDVKQYNSKREILIYSR